MIKTRHLILTFVPAILLVILVIYIQYLNYEPLYPDYEALQTTQEDIGFVPIFANDPILGNKQAPVTIIAFEDAACTHCKDQTELFAELLAEYPGKFKVVWKGLSAVTFPQSSERAHEYLYCAEEQGLFEPMLKQIFDNQTTLEDDNLKRFADIAGIDRNSITSCLNSERPSNYIEDIRTLARSLNVTGVPTSYVNGERIDAAITRDGWKSILSL